MSGCHYKNWRGRRKKDMRINKTVNSSMNIFSARNEKEHIVNMKGRSDVFHILWSLDCFIHSNIYQATNSVLGE